MSNLPLRAAKSTIQRATDVELHALTELAAEQLDRAIELVETIANEYLRRASRKPAPRHGQPATVQ